MSSHEEMCREYTRLSQGTGFVELPEWTTVVVTGNDRNSFLHNLCTNEIKQLATGDSREAFFADVKGKIIAHVVVTAFEEQILMHCVPGQAQTLITHLSRYIITEDVQLKDATADFAWFATFPGEGLAKWSEREDFAHWHLHHCDTMAGPRIGVATSDRERAKEAFIACDIAECKLATWDAMRIVREVPLFEVDFDSSNLPQEVNRDQQAISFNKGCYLGQETIARIDALGHVNQKCVAVQFREETVPPVGSSIQHQDKTVGVVTSSCWSPQDKAPLALAMVRRGANDQGTSLQSDYGNAVVR